MPPLMSRLLLGLVALPLAGLAYLAAQWLAPHVLESVPKATEQLGPRSTPARRRRLSPRQLAYVRAAAAVAVLSLIALGVSRWPASPGPTNASIPPAVAVQLPPPTPLKIQARLATEGPAQLRDPRDLAVD